MTEKDKGIEKTILDIGWYKEDQWDLLLKHAVDKEDLEPTYSEWLEGITEGMEECSKSGIQCEKIPVDVEESTNTSYHLPRLSVPGQLNLTLNL